MQTTFGISKKYNMSVRGEYTHGLLFCNAYRLTYVDRYAIMNKILFKGEYMKKFFICATSLLLCLLLSVSAFAVGEFTDVDKDKWYYEAIEYVYKNGVMVGITNTEFEPNTTTNRAMVVAVLARLAKADLSECTKSDFVDVEVDSWYGKSVVWAHKNGIVAGIDKTHFDPMEDITREQMCVMLSNYLDFMSLSTPNPSVEPFADIDEVSSWAVEAVERLQRADIVSGKENNIFDPKGDATRAEIAQIILSSRLADITITGEDEKPEESPEKEEGDKSEDTSKDENSETDPSTDNVTTDSSSDKNNSADDSSSDKKTQQKKTIEE